MSVNHDHARGADPVRGNTLVSLVMRARNGDEPAWAALVDRYAPLIWSICRQYRLGDADAADVGQTVWLHLAGQLDKLRDPAALPSWPRHHHPAGMRADLALRAGDAGSGVCGGRRAHPR